MFQRNRERSPYFLLAVDFGYTLLAGLGVFGYVGYWLDGRYGTSPWLLLAGLGLGLAVGFNGLFRRLNLIEQRDKARKEQEKKQGRDPRP